jgi:hypothetical protein
MSFEWGWNTSVEVDFALRFVTGNRYTYTQGTSGRWWQVIMHYMNITRKEIGVVPAFKL